jgi:hypothetical protein
MFQILNLNCYKILNMTFARQIEQYIKL